MSPRIRAYPHFDSPLSKANAELLVATSQSICTHKFFPFLEYKKRWTRFAAKGEKGASKERPIRYAARRDAYIFSHFREILQNSYESKLNELGLGDSVLAYRRIPTGMGKGNKCNIHFAKDAFERILQLGDCFAYALDISKYFESLDHLKIKELWAELLNVKKLPADHFQVYEAVTKFASIDHDKAMLALGYLVPQKGVNGHVRIVRSKRKIKQHLCVGSEFRSKVANLVTVNPQAFGIPQGSPISDVIANFYLIRFDKLLRGIADMAGGYYFRYSDDILLLMPSKGEDFKARLQEIQAAMVAQGDQLKIQDKKSSIYRFYGSHGSHKKPGTFELVFGDQGKNGLEYLGFRFNGKNAYLRDSTIGGLNRKIVSSARRQAHIHIAKRPGMSLAQLRSCFDYKALIERFGRIKRFELYSDVYSKWTFITYCKRSTAVFGALGQPIIRQMSRHKAFIRRKADEELERIFNKP